MNIITVLIISITSVVSPTPQVTDNTGEAYSYILDTYNDAEIAAAGHVVISFVDNDPDEYAAMVPWTSKAFPECQNAPRCILIDTSWWELWTSWEYGEDVIRVIMAHEFAHVLDMQRRKEDKTWAGKVNQVNLECFADSVTDIVLARGGWRPSVTDDYNNKYQCEQYWVNTHGYSLAAESTALAEDLLLWAQDKSAPPSMPVDIPLITGATATVGATRGEQYAA